MSQIASFVYLKEADVPFLGFWSKPKARLFRKPESKFNELLRQHTLRESIFKSADGVYVALVFAWLELEDREFAGRADPVLNTLRRRISGSHWLVKSSDPQPLFRTTAPLHESDWASFLGKIHVDERNYGWSSFETARGFVVERLSELQTGEALLISVG